MLQELHQYLEDIFNSRTTTTITIITATTIIIP